MSPMEMLVILLIGLLLFGPQRVTELARNLGRAVSEFKKGMNEVAASAPPPPPSPAEISSRPRDAGVPDASHGAGAGH